MDAGERRIYVTLQPYEEVLNNGLRCLFAKVKAQLSLTFLFVSLLCCLTLSFADVLVPSFPAAFLTCLGAVLDNTTPAACICANGGAHLTACNEDVRPLKYNLPDTLTVVVGIAVKLE